MKLFIDENVSRRIVERLELDGHTAVLGQHIAHGKQDVDLLDIARQLGAIVMTEDTDFGDLVMRQHIPSAGVILLRLSGMARPLQPDYIAHALTTHATAIPRSFTVIAPTSIRIRPLP